MPDNLRWSWCNSNRNKVSNECNVLESFWNHPPTPGLWKNYLPQNWSLVPKRLRTAALSDVEGAGSQPCMVSQMMCLVKNHHWWRLRAQVVDLAVFRFQSELCHLLALWPGEMNLTLGSLSFICRWKLLIPSPCCETEMIGVSWYKCKTWLGTSVRLRGSFLSFFFLISEAFFNWRIIALQCCVGFCCTTVWISCEYTYVPSLLSILPHSPRPTLLGHHRALSWVPHVTQQLPTIYLSILHVVVYICQCYTRNSSHPLLSHPCTPPMSTSSFSLCLFLHCG